ncbi:MAG: hypothetical protein CBD57_04955 [Candidatus Pelagibacter sp. TMED197]|nr:MAG: hypothetical protein CBD57_04955 [Candidatus Pelagibacter sp. TMED197]|tara:strand:- start:158 stop:613 length:456 start_codon:yes stop_codon:yes gene_type:complete
MSKPVSVDDNTSVAMPIRNMLAIIGAVAVGVWSYFGIVERLNISETKITLLQKDLVQATEMLVVDLEKNTEFRIKWPRGEMGSLPADSEQFMLIEDLYKTVEKMEAHIEGMMNNKLEIGFLKEQMKKAKEDIEKLKDADREIVYKNGNGAH